ncbi:Asp-tRNA(Asn)/Glu-tRNA(Gln) amidotransferase subunit GatB [Solitalea koreensis]|uniref:Aspartyl/glutamyl-tRNA(Asn/Gln) amidotransferase subunit B n=1 Tax=Solitalea koreensis TaxID=543615 RepID=A0A521BHC4_9SPHI|nr:Asp-tRNA(Asn)/Glu-tRNA(Gln) amidotransferase subunit GatB [Solitalea koreensis]SMO46505.1 aspartyl/glutamyl-tRNA(Asn/Gln) amidotransferase subunit B [Solitalea koreensis]
MLSTVYDKYEVVVGLEVHAQLATKSKIFSSDSAQFGIAPNTNINVISLGHPGTLPKLNEKVVEYAVKMGLATNCTIRQQNWFARKNYFYADLPKGYQISQDTAPICYDGHIVVKLKDGTKRTIRIGRIHMEEDAGKSMHDQDPYDSFIDLNRAGVPLVEIVSEPDIRSAEEAALYLTEIRKLLRYLEICDGNMEEGSMRCDANISVRLKGADKYGNRCEVKNMNSIRNVQRAIEHEFKRQVELIEAGEVIDQNTLNFDASTGTTSVLRSKEMANDYRYFPEPDLTPISLTNEYIAKIQAELPMLPEQLFTKFIEVLGLTEYDAGNLIENKEIAAYFECITQFTQNYKAAANWMMGAVKSYLNEHSIEIAEFPIKSKAIADLIDLIDSGKINNSVANQTLFPALIANPSKSPEQIAQELGLFINSDDTELIGFIDQVLTKYPDKVKEYHLGKKNLTGLFMGEVMKLSKGKIDPKSANKLLTDQLQKLK